MPEQFYYQMSTDTNEALSFTIVLILRTFQLRWSCLK